MVYLAGYFSINTYPRAYPGLILEGGKIKKKFRGGKISFFAQKYQFFSKIDLFFRKIGQSGGARPPCPPGYALAVTTWLGELYRKLNFSSYDLITLTPLPFIHLCIDKMEEKNTILSNFTDY